MITHLSIRGGGMYGVIGGETHATTITDIGTLVGDSQPKWRTFWRPRHRGWWIAEFEMVQLGLRGVYR